MTHHMDPLPSDLAALSSKAGACSTMGIEAVEHIIARLEHIRSLLTAPAPAPPPEQPDQQQLGADTSAAEALLTLSSYVKTANANVALASKEWATALTRVTKQADKRLAGPPPPLFAPTTAAHETHAATSNGTNGSKNVDPILSTPSPGLGTPQQQQKAQPSSSSSFSSPVAVTSLHQTIAMHLARIGAFDSLDAFTQEAGVKPVDATTLASLRRLHEILAQLGDGNCSSALEWVAKHSDADPDGHLEFELRKEEYIRLLLDGSDLRQSTMEFEPLLPKVARTVQPNISRALAYGGAHFRRLLTPQRSEIINALLTAPVYMPFSRLLASPYAPYFTAYAELDDTDDANDISRLIDLRPESKLSLVFAAAFLKALGLPKDSPLSVVTDIGGGGAMAKIQKVKAVMKEKKTEWSAVGELPVEIPLPVDRKYHSIFACPVSKEQSTATNPPMLLPCGHVIARESLARLARGTPTLKCPYCPVVSHVAAAVRVHF
ncbi:hypothetical protein OIV83_004871 [Microbotryomycetes sp. JL201]|nr:hypothetical protein OIV83_004871 [Microbotryomycetes sp. JL201]